MNFFLLSEFDKVVDHNMTSIPTNTETNAPYNNKSTNDCLFNLLLKTTY